MDRLFTQSGELLGTTQFLLGPRIQTTRLLTPPKHRPREFGEGPIMKNRFRRTLDLDRAEAPPFMSKTDHSTSETDRSSQFRTIHDNSKVPADSRLDSEASSFKFRD